ncbi:MAG: electron transfer flavoprotein subunit alpha/FixB family protein [Chloroflexota bacterium]
MIIVYVEHADGRADRVSLEALALAGSLGGPVHAALIGPGVTQAAASLGGRGVETVHAIDHDSLSAYAPRAYGAAVAELIATHQPAIVIGPGTERGNEVMAYVGAITGKPMVANVLSVEPVSSPFPVRLTRQRWAGSLVEEATLRASPAILTVAPHAIEAPEAASGAAPPIISMTPTLSAADLASRVTGRIDPEGDGVSLTDAKVVVGGGRGMGSTEGFAILEELADLLGGAVGGSRVVTSNGWRPHADQIGQTGLRIAPDIYIACGISGAIQHIVGCAASKNILAINKDPDAPIMSRAHYAVIGDLHAIVPAISAEIRRVRGT